jgi:Ca2+-transporting ATPase
LQGCSILVIVLAIYFIFLNLGYSEKEVRAMSFLALIVANVAIILSNRSWSRNIFQILATPNKTVKWIAGGAVLFLILILNIPFLMDLFQFEKIRFVNALICVVAGLLSITWFEVYKLVKREA